MSGGTRCPLPDPVAGRVTLAHGAGGAAMHRLVQSIRARLDPEGRHGRHDAATLLLPGEPGRLAFTTDGHVISPLAFPGGDIGALAVYGTANDLAVAGARPLALSCGLILEEGLALERVHEVVTSMAEAAARLGVPIVTGDTKVVGRGEADAVYVHTSGVGWVAPGVAIDPRRIEPGDVVLLSGDVGRHGVAVLGQREDLGFEGAPPSDLAPLWPLVDALLQVGGAAVHCLRDLTRGGLASALNELALEAQVRIVLESGRVPVHPAVQAACELYGLDPWTMACEGRLVAFVDREAADELLSAMRAAPHGEQAVAIGRVEPLEAGAPAEVVARGALGIERVVDLLEGEALPRIC